MSQNSINCFFIFSKFIYAFAFLKTRIGLNKILWCLINDVRIRICKFLFELTSLNINDETNFESEDQLNAAIEETEKKENTKKNKKEKKKKRFFFF